MPPGRVEFRLRGSIGDLAEAAARLAEVVTVVKVNGPHPNHHDNQHRLFVHAKLQPPVPSTS